MAEFDDGWDELIDVVSSEYEAELDETVERDPLLEGDEAQMIAYAREIDMQALRIGRARYRAGRRGSGR